jgi:hypothetical protein
MVLLVSLVCFLWLLSPTSAEAITDTYPWPSAPCEFGDTGGSTCTNPASAMSWDKYDWYLDEDNNGGFSGSACSGSNTSGECFDNLGYQYRNCTSYVAQKIYQIFGVRIAYWGSAEHWETAALAANYTLDPTNQPRVGDIAQWDTEAGGGSGHVAYVYAVVKH